MENSQATEVKPLVLELLEVLLQKGELVTTSIVWLKPGVVTRIRKETTLQELHKDYAHYKETDSLGYFIFAADLGDYSDQCRRFSMDDISELTLVRRGDSWNLEYQ